MGANKAASSTGESGFTLIDLLFTASLICTIATMALPSLLRARGVAQSASAVATLRVVNSAQLSFAVTCGSGFYAPTFTTLGVPPPAGVTAFLPPELSGGASSPGYAAIADPLDGLANPHYYATNADGTIYQHGSTFTGSMPESGPPPVGTPVKTQ
jgi:type II secretory pathway pseudopilin PulG